MWENCKLYFPCPAGILVSDHRKEGTDMNTLESACRAAARRLGQLDFAALWPGFRPYSFALYGRSDACMDGVCFPRPENFRGNTALLFRGRPTAIWDMERGGLEDMDILAAKLVHEMFHAFQLEQEETRFPDDLAALDYQPDAESLAWKWRENQLLAQAACSEDQAGARALLSQVMAIRSRREARMGRIVQCEYLVETAEGMAEYVELLALAALSPEKYGRQLSAIRRELEQPSPLLLEPRRLAYHTGSLLLLAARAAGLPFRHQIGDEARPVCRIVAQALPASDPGTIPIDPVLASLPAQRRREREHILTAFWARSPRYTEGDFTITGYDPMNMWKLDDRIYGNHFWQLRDKHTGHTITLTGETVLLSRDGREVAGYWSGRGEAEDGAKDL